MTCFHHKFLRGCYTVNEKRKYYLIRYIYKYKTEKEFAWTIVTQMIFGQLNEQSAYTHHNHTIQENEINTQTYTRRVINLMKNERVWFTNCDVESSINHL